MATLMELSESYRESAVRLRVGLREARRAAEEAEGPARTAALERVRLLRQMLTEAHRLRDVTAGYYTAPRDGAFTLTHITIVKSRDE